jgi:hypothetical protein
MEEFYVCEGIFRDYGQNFHRVFFIRRELSIIFYFFYIGYCQFSYGGIVKKI